MFLEWRIDVVGGKKGSAQGHFRHAGLTIEELQQGLVDISDIPAEM